MLPLLFYHTRKAEITISLLVLFLGHITAMRFRLNCVYFFIRVSLLEFAQVMKEQQCSCANRPYFGGLICSVH